MVSSNKHNTEVVVVLLGVPVVIVILLEVLDVVLVMLEVIKY